MNQLEKKYLSSLADGGLDADSAPFAVGTNNVVNAENVRWGSTDRGVTAVVESLGGTRQISTTQPSVTLLNIGTAEDVDNGRIVNFLCCITGPWHKITCYERQSDTEYIVLLSSQVTGGLGFSKNYLIHSARVINGIVYWTDELNRQRRVNIDAGIKLNNPSYVTTQAAYTSPVSQEVISLLKRPPLFPVNVSKATQPSIVSNFIGNNSFWFGVRYIYRDGETSVIGCHSPLVPYNILTDTYNRVDIELPFSEIIDQDVERVELGVRIDNNPQFFGIQSWDRNIASELVEINAHNAGTTALTYAFYNNQVGIPWGNAYSVKPFDRVPIKSRTLEIARNRLNLGNNLLGYNTPTTTSLSATLVNEENGSAVTGQWYEVVVDNGFSFETYYVIYIGGIGTATGYYSLLPYPGHTSLPLPSTIDFTDYELAATVSATIAGYFGVRPQDLVSLTLTGDTATVTNPPTTVTLIGSEAFKSNAPYQLGIVFYDFGDRKCGVLTNDQLVYTTADRTFNSIAFTTGIQWSLLNTNAVNEIPDWATTYAVVITKCLRTRYFLQSRASNMTYVTKDADGAYLYVTSAYANTADGVGVDITSLNAFNAGYTFTEGDLIKIYIDAVATVYTLRINAQDGKWLVCDLQDLGTLGTASAAFSNGFFEIYTPYRQSENEIYYEVGEKYAINNAGTVNRAYSILTDTIGGDVVLLQRATGGTQYLTENMSGNDKFFNNWFTDSGRVNIIDRTGQSLQTNQGVFSNTFQFGSNNNGISTFDALDEYYIPYECGDIQKLQVTSKVNNEMGSVMLVICTRQWVSIYIGEVQLVSSTANAFVAQSSGYIGSIQSLKGNYGTINPESVTEYRGMVFCYDAYNGRVIQYAGNGLFPISNYKMTRFWKEFSEQYIGMTRAQIEALGSRPFVFTTVDPYHNELLLTIPKLLQVPPKGYLPDLGEETAAVGTITFTTVGEDDGSIEVLVNDPVFGSISLGTYIKTSSDTSTVILAANVANTLSNNSYGYPVASNGSAVFITARSGLGTSINGGGRLTVNIISGNKLLINSIDSLLINATDKLLL
jgi:hypothetical protein